MRAGLVDAAPSTAPLVSLKLLQRHVVDVLKSELQLHTHLQDRLAEDRPYYRLPIFEISGRIFQKLQALTVRGTPALVSFAPLAFKLFYAARQNAVLRR